MTYKTALFQMYTTSTLTFQYKSIQNEKKRYEKDKHVILEQGGSPEIILVQPHFTDEKTDAQNILTCTENAVWRTGKKLRVIGGREGQ